MEKPDVDSVEGLSPAVASRQKNPTKTSRSTVARQQRSTIISAFSGSRWTHFLPELRAGKSNRTLCSTVTDTVLALPPGTRFYVTFPLRLSKQVTHDVVVENLRAQGFLRVAIDELCCTSTRSIIEA